MATPGAYQFKAEFLEHLGSQQPKIDMQIVTDPAQAVREATAIYTDVWTSMGQEQEAQKRRKAFAGYQINAELMGKAPADAVFMHCLPAHRGEEVTDEVIDGPRSVVVQQAANRLHVQKGILAWILGAQS
jgi:ornithine carbamoyltransferase